MQEPIQPADAPDQTEAMVAESGGYDLLKKRLAERGETVLRQAQALNLARLEAFGRSEQALILRTRARTENNCVPRDLVHIGGLLLFGYNVFIGLRKETAVGDVFALYRLADQDGGEELAPLPLAGTFLDEPRFAADFRELYTYYKDASLLQLRVSQDKLLAAFQIGRQLHDLRVFRWILERDGSIRYLDNRGERDIALPPSHDFEWTPTTRDEHVGGKHPHVNILDTVFVETVGGDLTVKVENNTETGLGVYSEPVEDQNQSLADAEIAYARLGALILLKVRPYREQTVRYLVFNTRTAQVERIDAIGGSCVQLPEDHGIIFPGGYYLQSGEYKRFDLPQEVAKDLRFKRMLRSPNGEDVLYIFYQPGSGHYALFTYNLIEKTLAPPILANGYGLFPDGRLLVFQADGGEPTRVHPMQLWRTAFFDEEHAEAQATAQGFFGRIGNAELVRGISDLLGIARAVRDQLPTRVAYEDLIRECSRAADAYFWLGDDEAGGLSASLRDISEGAQATLAEFEKVDAIRRRTAQALAKAAGEQRALITDIAATLWKKAEDFMLALGRLRERRGHLQSLKELRYIDLERVGALDAALAEEQRRVGERAMQFLAREDAFEGQHEDLRRISLALPAAATTTALAENLEELDATAAGLDLLTEQLGNLPGGDAVVRTAILDRVSTLYAEVNRLRAEARNRRRSLGSAEAAAEFGAQFKLFGQAVENALEFADSPEKCDDALTRLLAQLEELEGRFAEQGEFLADIAAKRESVYEALSARRQSLMEARQRRAQALVEAGERILGGIPRRVAQFRDAGEVHGYFVADPLIAKLRKLIEDLRALGAEVAAQDVETRLQTARDQALRVVRDKGDLVSEDGTSLRFGRHRFAINRQSLDLALVPREDGLAFHLTGTDYFTPLTEPALAELKPFWTQALVSETDDLYRAEYLAGLILEDAVGQALMVADGHARVLESVRAFAAPRYQEGYRKGVHDEDAARILAALLSMRAEAGLLVFGPQARALALLYWRHGLESAGREVLGRRARQAAQVGELYAAPAARRRLEADMADRLAAFAPAFFGAVVTELVHEAVLYLARQAALEDGWVVSGAGEDLALAFLRDQDAAGRLGDWQRDMAAAEPIERWHLALDWAAAYVGDREGSHWLEDAATILMEGHYEPAAGRRRINADLDRRLEGLLGEHPRIDNGILELNLNDFHRRYARHRLQVVPGFNAWQQLRQERIAAEKKRLRLEQFQARPLSSFVRNRLIDEVYLPLVGDNLAKQIGVAGEGARTDRMGLLLLISPPGYGKTTLMEYVADRLGLIFVRINGPAIGHEVTDLDPVAARHGAARQELEKLNLGLAMGNNVMLYLDDIQHTSPEFLQKFIALADGTRRIEGVFAGETRTWDLRGKRFAVVMAGNPYTESGEVFKIPDMLANRADIHNLGDVLSGQEALFALSYIENALTSNPVLLPLASRDPADVHLLVRMAQGEEIAPGDFSHDYGGVELEEMAALMHRLFRVRELLLKVNLTYIESAARKDAYRTEPPFKLQGSYRNMNKLAAQVTALMREDELDALLRDHYRGEAQTLTTGAEENLLKLAELLGGLNPEEAARWQAIKDEFVRRGKMGGDGAEPEMRVVAALLDLTRSIEALRENDRLDQSLRHGLEQLAAVLAKLQPRVEVGAPDTAAFTEAVAEMAKAYDEVLLPLVTATYHKLKLDHSLWDEMKEMSGYLQRMENLLQAGGPRRATQGKAPVGKPYRGGEKE